MDMNRFRDRRDAGSRLADALSTYRGAKDTVVFGLARGGVPVAAVVAKELGLPLEALLVRKVGAPANPELAVGAVTSVGTMVVNERVLASLGVAREELDRLADHERETLEQQARVIRGGKRPEPVRERTVILVDDGLATGASMEAAVRSVREGGAARIVVGVPVASGEAVRRVEAVADEVHCLMTPAGFSAVGQWYEQFTQTSNDEVRDLVAARRSRLDS